MCVCYICNNVFKNFRCLYQKSLETFWMPCIYMYRDIRFFIYFIAWPIICHHCAVQSNHQTEKDRLGEIEKIVNFMLKSRKNLVCACVIFAYSLWSHMWLLEIEYIVCVCVCVCVVCVCVCMSWYMSHVADLRLSSEYVCSDV